MNKNEMNAPVKEFLDEIKKYIDGQLEYNKVIFRKKGGEFTSQLVLFMMLFGVFTFISMFLSFAFVNWYTDNGGTHTTGFLIVSVVYLFIALIIFAFREALLFSPIRKILAKNLSSQEEREFFKGTPYANNVSSIDKYIEYLNKQNRKQEQHLQQQMNHLGEQLNVINLTKGFVKSGIQAIMTTSNMVKAAYQLTKKLKTKNRKKLNQ
jgi:hypothetical protein